LDRDWDSRQSKKILLSCKNSSIEEFENFVRRNDGMIVDLLAYLLE
jgi:hypothetical protein